MYDLAIIGGGPAGYSAAFEAVRKKMKVILFENRAVGGTCLNCGCIPTKYLSHVARLSEDMQEFPVHVTGTEQRVIDYYSVHARMNEMIASQRATLEEELREQIELIYGTASVLDCRTLQCKGILYEASNILIAAGSRPAAPVLPAAITSDELLRMDTVPVDLHILGGGTIAVEFANIFRAMGSNVTIYIRGDRILRKWDRDIAIGVTQSLKKKGIKIQKNCDFTSLNLNRGIILSAAGRAPKPPDLAPGLVEIGKSGGMVTDAFGRTKTPGIFAAGDVVEGSPQLAHAAMLQGQRIVFSISNEKLSPEPELIRCLYLDQECASVGLDEKTAADEGLEYVVGKTGMYSNARTMISTKERGFIKLLAAKDTGCMIGAQLMCERAGDLVAELALAINMKMTFRQLQESLRPHPSYCEAVTAALQNLGDKLYC